MNKEELIEALNTLPFLEVVKQYCLANKKEISLVQAFLLFLSINTEVYREIHSALMLKFQINYLVKNNQIIKYL